MSHNTLAEHLTAIALLGTARTGIASEWHARLEAWGLQPTETPKAKLLLQAASLQQSLAEAGGMLPQGAEKTASTFELPAGEVAPSPAQVYLQKILHEDHAPVLPEYLRLLGEKGFVLPPEHLPVLMDWAGTDLKGWQKIFQVLGPGGHFLLRHHPELSAWMYACSEAELATLTGERWLAGLRYWRFLAAEKTSEWIFAAWNDLTPDTQKQLLRMAEVGRHAGDIPWLHLAQQASLKPIRQLATTHLLHLHDEATLAVFRDWMGDRLRLEHRLVKIETPPKSLPEQVKHWGLLSASELKSKTAVATLLGRLPVMTWLPALAEFLTLEVPDRIPAQRAAYTYAVCQAIEVFGPEDWRLRLGRLGPGEAISATLAENLDLANYQTLLTEHLQGGMSHWSRARQLLETERPWSEATTAFLLDSILKAMNQRQKNFATWLGEVGQYELLQKAVYQGAVLDAKVAGDFYYDLSGRNYQLGLLADDMVKAWKFRHGLRNVFG